MEELFDRIDRVLTAAGYRKTADEDTGVIKYEYVQEEDYE